MSLTTQQTMNHSRLCALNALTIGSMPLGLLIKDRIEVLALEIREHPEAELSLPLHAMMPRREQNCMLECAFRTIQIFENVKDCRCTLFLRPQSDIRVET